MKISIKKHIPFSCDKLKKDILIYLGDEISPAELTNRQLNLAIDLGIETYLAEDNKRELFYLCLGHAMIMLGQIRSKFNSIPIPDGSLDMTIGARELISMGRKLIGIE